MRRSNLPCQSDGETHKQHKEQQHTQDAGDDTLTLGLVIRRCLIIAFHSWRSGREKKRPSLICLALSHFSSGGGTIGNLLFWLLSLSLLPERMAHRQVVSTFHCFNLGCSALWRSLNSDSDYDNDSYGSLMLALFLALS